MEDQSEKEAKFRRIRRLKKWMRPLPRRSNVHRYPVLKWFSKTAYERSYLWSFKGNAMIPALFWGIWIAMLPIVGIQMAVAFFVALIVREGRGHRNTGVELFLAMCYVALCRSGARRTRSWMVSRRPCSAVPQSFPCAAAHVGPRGVENPEY